ncbi:polysaccharide lyase family 7 protein [Streptacidiphilus sp. PB12-B1b]|uniref:polysaccharide lyase family 7 protein n=1 Tax=Streptacidiphilus sp. PB12-B1b TaxID=2705012 RepID=UPI0015FDFC3C|nr:polysaccharide lyase family 7 protein [Streptacidiphilus sp. PB12-B1b]QMU76883.1 polysaccharide lyase family 7 protein [Streptacidiphilus sp. PB12-B1b]
MMRMKLIAAATGVLALAAAAGTAAAANPVRSPTDTAVGPGVTGRASAATDAGRATSPISLSSWDGLLLPVNPAGQPSGKDAQVLSPARLIAPWLTQNSSGALTFWAPSGAATTPGSLHSRTELESADKYAVGTEKHVLDATLRILQLPKSNPEICVAQLHAGGSGGSSPFVMVDYKSGKLYAMVASGTSAPADFYTLLTGVPLDSSFSYRVTDNGNGTLALSAAAGKQSQSYTVAVPRTLVGASGHFSAGDYQQGTVSEGTDDGGRVQFTALTQS